MKKLIVLLTLSLISCGDVDLPHGFTNEDQYSHYVQCVANLHKLGQYGDRVDDDCIEEAKLTY